MDGQDGRWDTSKHDDNAFRKSLPIDFQPFWGWHDNMYLVEGPAVHDIARQFYLQWNDPASIPLTYKKIKYEWRDLDVAINGGTLDIQFLRTLGCRGATEGHYYQNNAPLGELTGMDAFMKMIRLAQNYIYLADQFVFFDEALEEVYMHIYTSPAIALTLIHIDT